MSNISARKINEFRNGIFAAQTRRFGTIAELIVTEKYSFLSDTESQHHDATTDTGDRIEIKFSRVLRGSSAPINKYNILTQVVDSSSINRALKSSDVVKYDFDCNIQQVKRAEFDELYYGLFFANKIGIFSVKSSDVTNIVGYSDFQHKGNKGEGQFHINNNTLRWHMDNNFVEWISYEEVYDIFIGIDKV